MKKILVIGANGFTGRRILQDLVKRGNYAVAGCSLHADIMPSAEYDFYKADIRDIFQLSDVMNTIGPDVVINTSALSVPDYCENHQEEAWDTNVTAVENLAQVCETHGARFIHLSTDFVFDGHTGIPYTEEDRPNPVNFYGLTKWEGEKRIAEISGNYAIVRVVVVYGNSYPGQHGNILQLVANKLRNGETIRVVSDQWRTPTFVGDISIAIERLMDHKNGIYHICGPDCLSIADIAYRVADYLKLDSSLILPVTTEEMNEATLRPRYSCLSIDKAQKEFGYQPLSIEEGIREMFG